MNNGLKADRLASVKVETDESQLDGAGPRDRKQGMKAVADIYGRQGFGAEVGMGDSPALLMVDFIEAFADPARFGGGNIPDAISNSVGLLAFARDCSWPVVHTRVVFAADGSDANVSTRKAPTLLSLTERAPGSRIVPELRPRPGELVLRKRLPSAFCDTGLAAWLVLRGVDTLIVAGCTTSGCVRASVVDAMGAGLRVIVATDCVGDRALPPHKANLFDMGQKYADLMTSAQIRRHIEARRRTAAVPSTLASIQGTI